MPSPPFPPTWVGEGALLTPLSDTHLFMPKTREHCPDCPVRCMDTGLPVFGEASSVSPPRFLILGETPGVSECEEGRPFVGPAGSELQLALDKCGVKRSEVYITNAIACRPPGNNLEALSIKVSRSKGKLVHPHTACAGRLHRELRAAGTNNILALGKTAAHAVGAPGRGITSIAGSCLKTAHGEVGVTYHPSFVLRYPAYREAFQAHVAKAVRYFEGKLQWGNPSVVVTSNPLEVAAMLRNFEDSKCLAYDIETDGIDVTTANIRCIGISDKEQALVVPFRHINGDFWGTMGELQENIERVSDFLKDPPAPLIGHNAGQFDRLVMEHQWGVTPKLSGDTILLSCVGDNELPHNLGFLTSWLTDNVEAWKADHTATQSKDDNELHVYCGKDCIGTARIATPLIKRVRERGQEHLLQREGMLQELGAAMQRNGLKLDKVAVYDTLQDTAAAEAQAMEELRAYSKVSPSSYPQLKKLLFQTWGYPPLKYSEKTGDPSADDETVRTMLTSYPLTDEHREYLTLLRRFRKLTKLRTTYLSPCLDLDRLHPSWSRIPSSGRYSSSSPNAQNWPYSMRKLVVPSPGNVLIGADFDQLEYRLIAEEAQAKNSLHIINSGLDPHNETMEVIYGPGIWKLPGAPTDRKLKGKGAFKATRDITKNCRYAWQYGASVKRVHAQVVSVEDEDGNLPYANRQVDDIRQVVDGLAKADPEVPQFWQQMQNTYNFHGWLADTLWGRRRYFKNESKVNDLVNHPIQSGGVAIVHEAMIELFYGVQPWFATKALSPGGDVLPMSWLICHGHDALYLDVPRGETERVLAALANAMNRTRKRGARLAYTAEAASGDRWDLV